MLKLLLIVLLAIIICCFSTTLSEKQPPKLTGKIVGGSNVDIRQRKYQISIQKYGNWHACGGTIITPRCILTAGHCLIGEIASELSVRAGSSNSEQGGQLVRVTKILRHPNFQNSYGYKNDVALLYLEKDLIFNEYVGSIPLCMATAPVGAVTLLSGWGSKEENGVAPTQLQQTQVRIVSVENCIKAYGSVITKEMICAAAPGKDTCQGDSGGPMVVNNCLAGVVSWGNGCARAEFPGVYANLGVLGEWVHKNWK